MNNIENIRELATDIIDDYDHQLGNDTPMFVIEAAIRIAQYEETEDDLKVVAEYGNLED